MFVCVRFKEEYDIVCLLIDKGAFVDPMNRTRQTPLMIATKFNRIDCVRMLIAAGATLDVVGENGCTALGQAVELGHLSIDRLLVQAGANVEARESGHDTPLLLAAKSVHRQALQIAKVPVNAGASLSTTASKKSLKTALHVAAESNHSGFVTVRRESRGKG